MPRKEPDPDSLSEVTWDDIKRKLPPEEVSGKPNRAYYRESIKLVREFAMRCAVENVPCKFNPDSMIRAIESQAVLAGLSLKHIGSDLTDEQLVLEACEQLLTDPDTLFEITDATLEALDKTFQSIVYGCEDAMHEIEDHSTSDEEKKYEELRKRVTAGKKMRSRISNVIRLRKMVRKPAPTREYLRDGFGKRVRIEAAKMARPLLFMAYTGRSNSTTIQQTTSNGTKVPVFSFGQHHFDFARAFWVARNGIIVKNGTIDWRSKAPWKGVVLVAPPGHGKTEFATHCHALHLIDNTTSQTIYLHAVLDKAIEGHIYIQSLLGTKTPAGRRRHALFPHVNLASKGTTDKKTTIETKEKLKSHSITASAVNVSGLGGNTDWQTLDDVVPKSDVEQPTERDRRKKTLGSVWGTRQRGSGTFRFIVGTMWHPEDFLSELVSRSTMGKGDYIVCVRKTGGPNTNPPFYALWPEVYPSRLLRQMYENDIRDPVLWSANYEANPVAESTRIIRALRYYDPNSQEHVDFIGGAQFHVSVDPTATNRETSDKAGFVYVAVGEVSIEGVWNRRMRFIDAQQSHVNQPELADKVAAYAMMRPVFLVHVETRSGFHATADLLEEKWQLTVHRHDPTNLKKVVRLKSVAGAIDDGMTGCRAVVEFPGTTRADGTVGPDRDKWGWFYDQFLNFGFAEDHCVDAGVQVIKYLIMNGELPIGAAGTSEIVKRIVDGGGDTRVRDMLKALRSQHGQADDRLSEHRWMMDRNNRGH